MTRFKHDLSRFGSGLVAMTNLMGWLRTITFFMFSMLLAGCVQQEKTDRAVMISPTEFNLGDVEQGVNCEMDVSLKANVASLVVDDCHVSCGCLSVPSLKNKSLIKGNPVNFNVGLFTGTEPGPFQQFLRVNFKSLKDESRFSIDVPVNYFVKSKIDLDLITKAAIRFENEDEFQLKLLFAKKRLRAEGELDVSQIYAHSKLSAFKVDSATVLRIPTLNGMIDDRWQIELKIDKNENLPEQITVGCGKEESAVVPVVYETKHPIELSSSSIFGGVIRSDHQKEFRLVFKNLSREPVSIKNIKYVGDPNVEYEDKHSQEILAESFFELDLTIFGGAETGRRSGCLFVEFETPGLSGLEIPISWVNSQ